MAEPPAGPETRRADAERIELDRVRNFPESARKTEEAWRLLMESVTDFAIILLDTDGRVGSWNAGAARLFGYGAEEIIGQPLSRLFTPQDRAKGLPEKELKNAASLGRASDDNWLERKDGSRFWASGATTPLRCPEGNLVGFAKVVRDLTERRMSEESLRKANESLEERVKARTHELVLRLKELEGFSSSVAHDLRAPLRSIHRYAETVLEDYRDRVLDAAGARSVERIIEAGERMDALIGHLLAYGRVGDAALELRAVDLGEAVARAVEDLSDLAQTRGAVVERDPTFPPVVADGELLGQILLNLLSNALKFVPEGVTPRVQVRSEARDSHVLLRIVDNGIGIAPEHQERNFLPFERLHGAQGYPGTGIGLAIVRRAAERMGGAAGVESQPGSGSRFWVDLTAVK